MKDNRPQINIKIDQDMMNNLHKHDEEFNKKYCVHITVSGLVKSIIKKFFEEKQ